MACYTYIYLGNFFRVTEITKEKQNKAKPSAILRKTKIKNLAQSFCFSIAEESITNKEKKKKKKLLDFDQSFRVWRWEKGRENKGRDRIPSGVFRKEKNIEKNVSKFSVQDMVYIQYIHIYRYIHTYVEERDKDGSQVKSFHIHPRLKQSRAEMRENVSRSETWCETHCYSERQYLHMPFYIHMYVYVYHIWYMYMYTQRERERERDR